MSAHGQGFTLLELLVVLLILALGAAVATPNVVKLVESLTEQRERDKVIGFLQQLPIAVMHSHVPLTLPQTAGYIPLPRLLERYNAEPLGDLSQEFSVWVPDAIDYHVNGACSGGITHWEMPGDYRLTLTLQPPLCQPKPGN